jgi:gamma-glutamyltranspeptidase/glutathione hydrolase
MRSRFGKLPMADLLAPAIYYADAGFPVTDVIADYWASAITKLSREPLREETFLPNGRAPQAGEIFKNRVSRRRCVDRAAGAAGFYEGKTPKRSWRSRERRAAR